jgi:putative intracellular protease/amidase
MQIAIPLYDRFTALDAVGPYEVLSRLPDARVTFIADERREFRTETGMLGINTDATFDDIPAPDVILVPGGFGTRAAMDDEAIVSWIRNAHETSTWTTSVCTGSLLLGAAGILDGLEATTHWAVLPMLEELGATPVKERVVEQGKVVTAAGVSAGIDLGLTLAGRIAGEDFAKAVQLAIEYDPDPPFDCGSPDKVDQKTLELVGQALAGAEEAPAQA